MASSRVVGRLSDRAWVGPPTTSRSMPPGTSPGSETVTSRTATSATALSPSATARATRSELPNIDSYMTRTLTVPTSALLLQPRGPHRRGHEAKSPAGAVEGPRVVGRVSNPTCRAGSGRARRSARWDGCRPAVEEERAYAVRSELRGVRGRCDVQALARQDGH